MLHNPTSETSTLKPRLLVICVDRDDDVGEKTGIKTPVIGRNACIDAAQRLALEDPEDADSNAIFSAIKTYEDLISKGYVAEVIIVTGVRDRGVQADEKIVLEIKSFHEKFSATGAVIVSDGEDDESVIPIIQTVLPIVSVQRLVMKTSRSVEYSYAVFGKYLKMIAYDTKYSKFFLGVPGILLLIGGIATVFGYTAEIFAILVSVLGGAFLIRAFDIDRAWASWTKPTPTGFIKLFTMITGIILIIVSIGSGITSANLDTLSDQTSLISILSDRVTIGYLLSGALPILWIGIGVIFAGTYLTNLINGIKKQITDILRLVVLTAIYPTMHIFTDILISDTNPLLLIVSIIIGLSVTLFVAMLLFKKYRNQKIQEME